MVNFPTCQNMVSDKGTNFVGVKCYLQEINQLLNSEDYNQGLHKAAFPFVGFCRSAQADVQSRVMIGQAERDP